MLAFIGSIADGYWLVGKSRRFLMSDRTLARKLLQEIYYDAIDAGDMSTACTALHPDVDWSHSQVWPHGKAERSGARTVLHGRAAVEAFLTGRKQLLSEPRVHHKLGDFVMEGAAGAARSYVEDGSGVILPFTLWFEIRGALIYRYAVYAVISPFLQPDEAQAWIAEYGR